MPKLSFADAPRAPEAWAEVRANDRVMRYRRAGTGRAVIVLYSANDPQPPWPALVDALVDALGAGFRLILPEPPDADADIAEWLADFLEGLGMSNIGIVAAGRFCIPTLELTLLGVDQVARIVLVPNGRGGETGLGGALETATGQAVVPLLVVRDGHPMEEILPIVTRFLAA
jgi:hypothetical protein